jgi:UDP-N-acetylmuramoyl-L-alanyl-D-glutamate--2,6-diaminopimelate ligase
MRLSEVVPGPPLAGDPLITNLAFDSRRAGPGTLFFCVRGFRSDGHEFAPAAVAAGAVALVAEEPLGLGVPEILVPDARAAMAPAAARFEGDPTRRLDVIGITGTNGKTTTAHIVRALLEAAGRPCGLLGTVGSVIGGEERPAVRTTPEAIDLQADFRAMVDAGDRACAMEVSSHALELHRADAITFAVAIFTNLTQDHLDFHPDLESYFQAKRRLLTLGPRTSVIDIDDAHGARLAAEFPEAVTVGIDAPGATLRAREVTSSLAGSRFTLATPEGAVELATPLPGRFNVRNVLAALAAVRALGIPLAGIAPAVAAAGRVPGRFEPVSEGQDFAVLVDYAHTPDSLENVLRAAREISEGDVIVVFGAGGDRDRAKRPLMGALAAELADRAIVTSDNPRSEDPHAIIAEILAGIGTDPPHPVLAEPDRRVAIRAAVDGARTGDVVVIAGKGHEHGQEFADGLVVPYDDVSEARAALRERVAG